MDKKKFKKVTFIIWCALAAAIILTAIFAPVVTGRLSENSVFPTNAIYLIA
jgi:hypothetical protein